MLRDLQTYNKRALSSAGLLSAGLNPQDHHFRTCAKEKKPPLTTILESNPSPTELRESVESWLKAEIKKINSVAKFTV